MMTMTVGGVAGTVAGHTDQRIDLIGNKVVRITTVDADTGERSADIKPTQEVFCLSPADGGEPACCTPDGLTASWHGHRRPASCCST